MTTLESLTRILKNFSKEDHKIVRRYLTGTNTHHDKTRNKGLQLIKLITDPPEKSQTPAQLQKQLYGQRHPAAFARLVADLHKRIMEALSLPVMTRTSQFPERVAAQIQFHRQYIKALVLFEAGEYASADETLLALISLTTDFELDAERIAVVGFLMHVIRIYGNEEAIKHFKDMPQHALQMLSLFASGEDVRDQVENGELKEIHHLYSDLKGYARECKSTRAMFILTGIEGKVAEVRGDYTMAEKYFLEQLGYCKNPAVDCEEYRAQVYVDIARVAIRLGNLSKAKQHLRLALRCRKKFKKTAWQIDQLNTQLESRKP